MKSSIFIFLLSVFVLNFSSGQKRSTVSLVNLSNGQRVSGHVLVKLASGDLSTFRRVSYCLDDELISNIYDPPFTLDFDTRDFSNGEHTLSARVLTEGAIMALDTVNIIIKNENTGYNFIFQDPRRLVAEDLVPYHQHYIDAPHPVLKKNDHELYFFQNKGLMMHIREKRGITSCFSGPLEEPFKTLEWSDYVPEIWDKNGHPTQGVWLMSIYKIGKNELLGFTHDESCYDENQECSRATKSFALGVGYSSDNGHSWLYCGDVVRHNLYDEYTGNNMGGVPYIVRDGYFYIYYQEYAEREVPYPGVARAAVEDVIAAARKGKSVEWMKYRNGEWNEPGLTGLSDNLTANLGIDFNMHCKATYVPSIGKYLMLTYKRNSSDLYFLTSDDGLNWEIADYLKDMNSGQKVSYPFFGDFYTDDCHEVDDDFYIYWTKNHRELWAAQVHVETR